MTLSVDSAAGPGAGAGAGAGGSGSQRGPPGANIYINNVDPRTDEEGLRALFAPYGNVRSVRLFAQHGYGFVSYDEPHAAAAAIAYLHGSNLGNSGRPLEVSLKKDKGGGGGGSGGGGGGAGGGVSAHPSAVYADPSQYAAVTMSGGPRGGITMIQAGPGGPVALPHHMTLAHGGEGGGPLTATVAAGGVYYTVPVHVHPHAHPHAHSHSHGSAPTTHVHLQQLQQVEMYAGDPNLAAYASPAPAGGEWEQGDAGGHHRDGEGGDYVDAVASSGAHSHSMTKVSVVMSAPASTSGIPSPPASMRSAGNAPRSGRSSQARQSQKQQQGAPK